MSLLWYTVQRGEQDFRKGGLYDLARGLGFILNGIYSKGISCRDVVSIFKSSFQLPRMGFRGENRHLGDK